MRVAKDPHAALCTALNAKGEPCQVWASRQDDSGLCSAHRDPERWRAIQASGGRARQESRRESAGLRTSSRHRHGLPGPTLAKMLTVIGGLLDATIPGSTEPNMLERGLGVYLALELLGIRADQRAEALEVLAKIRPNLANDPQVARLLRFEEARQALLREVAEGRLDASYLPPWLVPSAVAASRAA